MCAYSAADFVTVVIRAQSSLYIDIARGDDQCSLSTIKHHKINLKIRSQYLLQVGSKGSQ